jgi:hypothetical protein
LLCHVLIITHIICISASANLNDEIDPVRLEKIKSTHVDSLSQNDYLHLVFYVRDRNKKISEYKNMLKDQEHLQKLKDENARREAKTHYEKGFRNGIMAGIGAGIIGIALVIQFFKSERNTR